MDMKNLARPRCTVYKLFTKYYVVLLSEINYAYFV